MPLPARSSLLPALAAAALAAGCQVAATPPPAALPARSIMGARAPSADPGGEAQEKQRSGDPRRWYANCPGGNFCVAEPDAPGSRAAPAPYQSCARTVPPPARLAQHGDRVAVEFSARMTTRARRRGSDACCYNWYYCSGAD